MKPVLVCFSTCESARRFTASADRLGLTQSVRTVTTTEEIHQRIASQSATILLAHTNLMQPNPTQFTRTVLARSPQSGVVVVTVPRSQVAALTVVTGIRDVAPGIEGDLALTFAQAMMVSGTMPPTGVPCVPRQRIEAPDLTGRQIQVLQAMSHGKSNIEIGRELFMSEDTVKTHARRLYKKLGARDRAHAVAEALRQGIVH